MRSFLKILSTVALGLAVAACGGGGSDAPAVAPATAPAPVTITTISGVATYQSVPNFSATNAGLNYAAAVAKPIRGVTVQALDAAGNVLTSTTTGSTGFYSFQLPSSAVYQLRVRAELIKTQGPATWNVQLIDNVNQSYWAVDIGGLTPAVNATRNINATTGWNAITGSYTGFRAAGLFAILDTIYDGMQKVISAQPTINFPELSMFWSEANTTATGGGGLAVGNVGSSFFSAGQSGGVAYRQIVILGKAGNDTDEFDAGVVAHEYGHYLQNAFSTNAALGGRHTIGEKLDMTIAFSEAWGNAYSSMVRNTSTYADSLGPTQNTGFTLNLAALPTDAARGWYREDSVAAILYNFALSSSGGFTKTWAALSGPMKSNQDSVATIFSFADAVRSVGNITTTTALNTLVAGQNITTTVAANQWGAGEVNSGGNAANLPVYSVQALGTSTSYCLNKDNNTTDPTINKLGNVKYIRHTVAAAGARTIAVSFAAGSDFLLQVFQRGVQIGEADADVGLSESLTVNVQPGDIVIRVLDYNTATLAAGAACGTVSIN
jgi:hypothetical protein